MLSLEVHVVILELSLPFDHVIDLCRQQLTPLFMISLCEDAWLDWIT